MVGFDEVVAVYGMVAVDGLVAADGAVAGCTVRDGVVASGYIHISTATRPSHSTAARQATAQPDIATMRN